ncbi:MAG: DUF2336 domain-containing protein [Xanthobacteraceae bacterium]
MGRGHQEGKREDRVRPHGGVPRGPTKLRANTAETAIVNAVLLATARLRTQHLAAMQQLSLIDDLETAIKQGNPASRVETLRRITDLFLHDADRLNDEQISVFDDVLCLLAEKIEKTALVELGSRLAPVDMSPIKVVRRLARDDQIEVAAPVLIGSRRLSTADLVEIVKTKSQDHLLAISERITLEPTLTDALLVRGNQQVVSTLAKNAGAQFSDMGFTRLVERADGDDSLGELVGLRRDLPRNLLQELLRRATEAVKQKILSLVPPERRQEVERMITKISQKIGRNSQDDYGEAERFVAALAAAGELDEAALLTFVRKRQRTELAAAIARMSSSPTGVIVQLLSGQRNDAILLPCKAAQLSWPTVEFILHDKLAGQRAIDEIIALARKDYAKLTVPTAQRTLRFMNVHEAVK